mmetsp:Transcript_33196/g.75113  ORF Transcript_33196/g.75113 Transcript_33196/m.75113 type:complete len:862 (+) Transcript_33196:92-2677(+)
MERPMEASSFIKEARLGFEYSISNFIWKQAVFFAERLVAECPCDEMTYLLALAYFHNQETARAHWHLHGNKLPEARYLLARCCFILQRWEEAEEALLPGPSPTSPGNLGDVVNGAAGLYLLGQVKEKQSKREQAVECYAKCLELCPFMWDAYERWSWLILGSPSPSRSSTAGMAASTFSDEKLAQSLVTLGNGNGGSTHGWHQAACRAPPAQALGTATAPGQRTVAVVRQTAALVGPGQVHATPCGAGGPLRSGIERATPLAASGGGPPRSSQNAPPRNDREPPHSHAPPRKERRAGEPQPRLSGHGAAPNSVKTEPGSVQARRHLFGTEGAGGVTANDVGGEFSLAALLCKLGVALHAMHSFENQQTIQMLSTLPRRHYETGYVLDLVGRCYFESSDYKKAELVFQQVWRIEPRRLEGLEYYSSALWHLRKDIELGHLAQQCLQWDRLKPQVWCVVGNCFSLQKEHDVAIKFFKRAIQVDPSYTYAYTLCGHEFVANEKFDKAIPMYEQALSVDTRHYNAWWGLGNIYHRQEEHENARYHFLKAMEINKTNSVLRCYLGMVLDSLNSPLMALENFDRASQGEPQNGMAYFQKACVLMTLERFDEALADLKKVRCLAPKEACVHFQLGKVYMKLQRDKKALLHFNIAMDLNRDSKDYHTIKTHIEQLHIRGVKEADTDVTGKRSQGRIHSSSSSNAGDDRDRSVGIDRIESHHFFPAQGGSPHGASVGSTSGGTSTTNAAAVAAAPRHGGTYLPQQHYGGGSPGGRTTADLAGAAAAAAVAAAGPQTPAVARGSPGAYGAPVGGRGGLWSPSGRGGHSSTAAPAAFHPAAGRGGGSGRGGSPSSWTGGAIHGPAANSSFRI